MKSYFLAPIASHDIAVTALSEVLHGQSGTWLFTDTQGDAIAYFSLVEHDDTTGLRTISADISGRHYNQDSEVIAILRRLQAQLGGELTNDDGEITRDL